MFWKKKKDSVKRVVDIQSHLREFLYDSQLEDAERLSVALGSAPISQELQEHEEDMSDLRVQRISYLLPLIHSYAHLVSEGVIALEKGDAEEDGNDFPEEFWEMMHKLLEQISISVTVGVLSQLVELELVKVREV